MSYSTMLACAEQRDPSAMGHRRHDPDIADLAINATKRSAYDLVLFHHHSEDPDTGSLVCRNQMPRVLGLRGE